VSSCRIKGQRLQEGGQKDDGQLEVDVRLSEELRGPPGGRKYVNAKDLAREILLDYAKRQGAFTTTEKWIFPPP
jgi:hypothetical protein